MIFKDTSGTTRKADGYVYQNKSSKPHHNSHSPESKDSEESFFLPPNTFFGKARGKCPAQYIFQTSLWYVSSLRQVFSQIEFSEHSPQGGN